MYQKPTMPRDIGGVLDDSIQLYKASLRRLLVAGVAGQPDYGSLELLCLFVDAADDGRCSAGGNDSPISRP